MAIDGRKPERSILAAGATFDRAPARRTTPDAGICKVGLWPHGISHSRWTFTVAAWLLRSHGSSEVFPLALAFTGHEK